METIRPQRRLHVVIRSARLGTITGAVRPGLLFYTGLRHFSCLIFVGQPLRHYLEDDEDNEIGFRARDCPAIRSVPREPLGGIGGGVTEANRARAAAKLPDRAGRWITSPQSSLQLLYAIQYL
jgi:hypothetical protein